MSPIIFSDVDDVLVLQRTPDFDKHAPALTDDLCLRLLHAPAMQVLAALVEGGSQVVITSNWTRFLNQAGFQQLFNAGGYPGVSAALHPAWAAPTAPGGTRLDAIDRWLAEHHAGEPFVIVDDTDSGSGLRGSAHDLEGRVVLCERGVGLHPGHLPQLRSALSKPSSSAPLARSTRSRRR